MQTFTEFRLGSTKVDFMLDFQSTPTASEKAEITQTANDYLKDNNNMVMLGEEEVQVLSAAIYISNGTDGPGSEGNPTIHYH